MKLRFLLVVLALSALVGCDHGSKHWAESRLGAGDRIEIVDGVLGLRYTRNHDTAFSLMRQVPIDLRTPIILVLASITTAAVAVLLYRRRRSLPSVTAYTLILGGAIGNVSDRFVRGYVVDFIHLQHWPIFNFADIWVAAGIGLLLLSEIRPPNGAKIAA